MPDYQKAKIYKLWSPSKNLVYYGSTTETISRRLAKHLTDFKIYNAGGKKYVYSFKILELEDYKIELIEDYPCNNRQQLCKKEGEYIQANECVNKAIAGRTLEEWREENPDKIKEYAKKFREENPDKRKEYDKKYCDANADKKKECAKKYREANRDKIREQDKKYRDANADKIRERGKKYRDANADEINERNRQRYLEQKLNL